MKTCLNFFVPCSFLILQTGMARSQCAPSTAQADLDIGNVRARMLCGGDMWSDFSAFAQYEVPKGSGKHSLFAGALWIGGIDQNFQIKIAAQTYRQTGIDFWPGPLSPAACIVDSLTCDAYDQHWKITRQEVQNFVGGGPITPAIATWPGSGIVPTPMNTLAPFVDVNSDGLYDPSAGDYPGFDLTGTGANCCDYLHGDQAVWWVLNDVGNAKTQTGSMPISLEVRCQAFAFDSPDEDIRNTTFYQYHIVNCGITVLHDAFFGQWVDPDLGNPVDDYAGCDVPRGLGYCYNGDADDDGVFGYGIMPPAVGADFLRGPEADLADSIDNDRDGCVDCTFVLQGGNPVAVSDTLMPEYWSLAKFMAYGNVSGVPWGNPAGSGFYNYLAGIWQDGLPLTFGGDGRDTLNPACSYMFPGNTDPGFPGMNWTEITAGNPPADRRFVMSAGPFNLQPGEVNCVVVAVVWARDTVSWANGGITALQAADDKVQAFFDACFDPGVLSVAGTSTPVAVSITPNPFSGYTIVTIPGGLLHPRIEWYDLSGRRVMYRELRHGRNRLEQVNLPAGLYLYRITDDRGTSAKGKLILL